MKKLLLILLLLPLFTHAQKTYFTPGIPPGSASLTLSNRWIPGDSLTTKFFLGVSGVQFWQFYTAAQVNALFPSRGLASSTNYGTFYNSTGKLVEVPGFTTDSGSYFAFSKALYYNAPKTYSTANPRLVLEPGNKIGLDTTNDAGLIPTNGTQIIHGAQDSIGMGSPLTQDVFINSRAHAFEIGGNDGTNGIDFTLNTTFAGFQQNHGVITYGSGVQVSSGGFGGNGAVLLANNGGGSTQSQILINEHSMSVYDGINNTYLADSVHHTITSGLQLAEIQDINAAIANENDTVRTITGNLIIDPVTGLAQPAIRFNHSAYTDYYDATNSTFTRVEQVGTNEFYLNQGMSHTLALHNGLLYDSVSGIETPYLTSVSAPFNAKADTVHINYEAWVSTTGSDVTGMVGRQDKPFATIQAAQDASLADTVTAFTIHIGIGTFNSPVLKRSNANYIGSGMPQPNWKLKYYSQSIGAFITTPTALIGGTILNGRWLDTCFNNIHRINLGIDVGKTWTTTFNSGNPIDATFYAARFKISGGYPSQDGEHQLQTNYPQLYGIIDENIINLCRDSSSAVHANLKENCYNPVDINVVTVYGQYGSVYKTVHGKSVGGSGYGHGISALTIKSNDYAYGWGMEVSNFSARNIKGFDCGGIYLLSENSKSLEFPKITTFHLDSVKYGIKTSAVVDGAIISNGTIDVSAGRGIYLDPSFAFGSLTNIDIRGSLDTGIYFTQAAGSFRRTNFNSVRVANGSRLGWFLNPTSSSQVVLSDCQSTTNGGAGYNIAGNVTSNTTTGIYTINNTGGTGTGAFTNTASGSSDPLVTIGTDGNIRKSTILLSQFTSGGETLASVTGRGASTATATTWTGKLSINLNEGLAVGASTEKLNFGSNGSWSTNRDVGSGTINDNTRFAYQWNHTGSTTALSDAYFLQVYNVSGTQITPNAIGVNGGGDVLINTGATTVRGHAVIGAGTATVAPLVITSGTSLTTPVPGAIEYDGTNLFYTVTGPTRRTVANLDATQTFTNKTFTSPAINGATIDGTTIGVTQTAGDNSTKLATTAFVQAGRANLIIGTPTIVAGAGAGTSPTVSVTSNGRGLQVTLTVGTLPAGTNATVATITLANALSFTPYPVYSTANATASLLSGATMVYFTSTGTANVTITSGTTALPAGTYIWNIAL